MHILSIWNTLKEKIETKNKNMFFLTRSIWWIHVGQNIGTEEHGKNNSFVRPVLVLRKFNHKTFWGIPLSSKEKDGPFYHSFTFHEKKQTALLSQLRIFDSKRLKKSMGRLDAETFNTIKKKTQDLLS